ncbi:hypothetical protein DITRI_Ditri04bG0036700 [Diplodiscus trichospermus]
MRAFKVKADIEVNKQKGDRRVKKHGINDFMAVQEASYAASPTEAERSKEEHELHGTSETFLASDHAPELVVFLQESDYQSIKDIFIDREVPSRSRLKYKDISSKIQQDMDGHSNEPGKTLKIMSSISNEIEQDFQSYARKQHALENLIKDGEEDSDGRDDDHLLDMSAEKMIRGMQHIKQFKVGDSISLNPTEPSATEPIDDNSHLSEVSSNSEAESGSTIQIYDSCSTTMSSHEECLEGSASQKPDKTESLSRASQSSVNELGYGDCGSFAVSLLSGPTPCSGSISLQSTSSATSSHSFAFPILPSEWNGSPVRMVEADQRQQRKHQSWRTCFLC